MQLEHLNIQEFGALLKPCLEWCSPWFADKPPEQKWGKIFRSEALADAARKVLPESCHTKSDAKVEQAFCAFQDLRKSLLGCGGRKELQETHIANEILRPKSLLITDWAASLFDGAVAVETSNFIDEDYIPPWDTWVGIVTLESVSSRMTLVSWVPWWLSDKMDEALGFDPAECQSWVRVGHGGRLLVNGCGQAAQPLRRRLS
jgi:hypothetical protein